MLNSILPEWRLKNVYNAHTEFTKLLACAIVVISLSIASMVEVMVVPTTAECVNQFENQKKLAQKGSFSFEE